MRKLVAALLDDGRVAGDGLRAGAKHSSTGVAPALERPHGGARQRVGRGARRGSPLLQPGPVDRRAPGPCRVGEAARTAGTSVSAASAYAAGSWSLTLGWGVHAARFQRRSGRAPTRTVPTSCSRAATAHGQSLLLAFGGAIVYKDLRMGGAAKFLSDRAATPAGALPAVSISATRVARRCRRVADAMGRHLCLLRAESWADDERRSRRS